MTRDIATTQPMAVARPNEHMDLVKRQLCPGASDLELQYFLETARELDLSPLSREIYAIMRNTRTQVNGQWQSVPKLTIQIGIDGYRTIGARTGRFGGMRGPYWCGPDGEWRDVWLSDDAPSAAKVEVVLSDTRETVTGIATWKEFSQWMPTRDNQPPKLGEMWQKMPAHMLAKCAEAQAWRKALPAQTQRVLEAAHVEFTAAEPPTTVPGVTVHLNPRDTKATFFEELERCGWDESDALREFGTKDLDHEAERRGGWAEMTLSLRANIAKRMRTALLEQGMPPTDPNTKASDVLYEPEYAPKAALQACELCGLHEAEGFWGETPACQSCIDLALAKEQQELADQPTLVPFPDSKPASMAQFQMEAYNRLGLQPAEITRILGAEWQKGKKAADLPALWQQLQAKPEEQLVLGDE